MKYGRLVDEFSVFTVSSNNGEWERKWVVLSNRLVEDEDRRNGDETNFGRKQNYFYNIIGGFSL